jgi:outer membrane protein OmpA-like peptidoglycan-associated protein
MIAFAAARNSEIETAMAAVGTRRLAEFATARNREIELAMSTHELQRATLAAGGRLGRTTVARGASPAAGEVIETGSVETGAETPGARACRGLVEGLAPVAFASSAAEIDAAGMRAIGELARIAGTCAGSTIQIHGHTDGAGSAAANKRLSKMRARAVAAELIKSGIDAGRLEVIGHGATAPIAPNTTAENRARNRRIEFTFKDKTLSSLIEVR